MRLSLSIILALLLAVTVSGEDHAAAPSTASTYQDNTYHFSLNGPDLGLTEGSVIPVTFIGPAKDGFAPNVNVMIQPEKMSPEQYLQVSLKELSALHGKMNSHKKMNVSGHDALLMDYQGTTSGRDLHFLSLVVFTDTRMYRVTCTALADNFASHAAEFRKCLDSFQLQK